MKLNLKQIGTLLVGLIFIGSMLAYAFSYATSNPTSKAIKDPVRGVSEAKVTIVEFSDFQCSHCRKVQPTVKKILENYRGEVKLVFKNLPISSSSFDAAVAGECAHLQGKFWEYHDLLFNATGNLDYRKLKEFAKQVGMNTNKFDSCFSSQRIREEVRKDIEDGENKGVEGTPTFFINGQKLVGSRDYSKFQQIIESEL